MNWLALSLYALGVLGAIAAVSRDAPMGTREYVIVIAWPAVVVGAMILGLCAAGGGKRFRP